MLYPALFDFTRRKEGDTAERNLPLMGGRVCFDQDGTDPFSGKESAPVSEADWRGMCDSRCRDKGARYATSEAHYPFDIPFLITLFQTFQLNAAEGCLIGNAKDEPFS